MIAVRPSLIVFLVLIAASPAYTNLAAAGCGKRAASGVQPGARLGEGPSQTKAAADQNYPAIIPDSQDRRLSAERDWRRMLDAYNSRNAVPDLYPITYTPSALPHAVVGMRITAAGVPELADGAGLREAIKEFLGRWRDLLQADADTVSLVSTSQAGDVTRLSYIQANYAYPIVGQYGTMSISITSDGRLREIDDRFIPVVDLPGRPTLDRASAADRVVGRTFTYANGSETARIGSVTELKNVTVVQMVVLPIQKQAGIEVHLAWQVAVTASPRFTVYVDAINGEVLSVEPDPEGGSALRPNDSSPQRPEG